MRDISIYILKASNVKVRHLINILLYKGLFAIAILSERINLKLFYKQIYSIKNSVFSIRSIDSVYYKFKSFYQLCCNNNSIIISANECINNNIKLFGSSFNISSDDWLVDPITKNVWNGNVFFTDAKVEEDGLGDVKYILELNKMYHLVLLAQAYNISNDEKYIRKISEYLNGWIVCVKYEKSVVNKGMLDIAFRCLNLIYVSLLCFKSAFFQKNISPFIISILVAAEEQIRKFSTPRWCKYTTGANHTIGEMVGLIVTQLWLEYFTNKKYDQYLQNEFKYLHNSLDNIITPNGVYLEQSSNYSKLVAEFLMLLDIFSKAIGNNKSSQFYNDKYLRNILQYINCLAYNNQLPNFGDNDGAKATYPFYEHEYSIAHLIRYYEILHPDCNGINSLVCKESGQFIWKSDDAKQLFFFIRSGKHSYLPIGSGSHAHNDILSLILAVNNEELFIDSGTFLYNSGLDILNNDRLTSNHNTISIAKVEQAPFVGKWLYGAYPISNFIEDEIIVEKSSFCFCGKCSYSDKSHIRHIEYNNSQMIINDTIECNIDDDVSINFLLSPIITVKKISETIVDLYKNENKVATMSFDCSICINIRESNFYPSYGIEKKTKKVVGVSNKKGSQLIKTSIYFH